MKNHYASYLERLTFTPKLATTWVAKYLTNIRIVILLLLTIFALGLVSYFQLPQRLNPEINIPIVIITSVLPGASPGDVESLLTKPIEDELQGITGIDTLTSTSAENVSTTVIQFHSTVNGEKAKDDVQSAIDDLTKLPEDATTPSVRLLDFEDQPIWTFAVSTSGDVRSLMTFTKALQQRIDELPLVTRVEVSGFETQEIVVTADPSTIDAFGISAAQLSQTLQKAVASYPAGILETANTGFSFTIDPSVTTLENIRNLRLTVNNTSVKLDTIATLMERSEPDIHEARIASNTDEGKRVVVLYVFKTSTAKIGEASNQVKDAVEETINHYHNGFEVTTIQNTADEIKTQFTDLLGEFRTTIFLVFLALLAFLGLKQALLSSLTVPLTFLSAFMFMNMLGMSINFLSLFAFLLTLGLLVDDTIVVISAMTRYFRTGKFSPVQTGILVWKDTIVPIWSTTITTIWSFIPLLLSTGIIGEFIKPIPVVVTVTMISSTAIAVLITLPLMIVILKPKLPFRVVLLIKILVVLSGLGLFIFLLPKNPVLLAVGITYLLVLRVGWMVRSSLLKPLPTRLTTLIDRGFIDLKTLERGYFSLMIKILNSKSSMRKVIIMNIAYALFAFSLLPLGLVKNEFFPKTDYTLLYVTQEFPQGTRIETMKSSIAPVVEQLRHYEGVEFVIAETGRSMSQEGTGQKPTSILYTLHLPADKKHRISSIELAEKLRRELQQPSGSNLLVVELTGGPPAGADLQIKLLGSDLGELDRYANQIMEHLKQQPGITNVDKSIKPGPSKLTFVPDPDRLVENNLSIDALSFAMRTYTSGFTLDEINFDKRTTEKEQVIFRYEIPPNTVESIGQIRIPTTQGETVPLVSLGKLEPRFNPTSITREDQRRTLSVSAGVRTGYNISKLNQELERFTTQLHLPDGYYWQTGGINEENQESVISILQAMLVAFILILVTMVLQFNSYRQALIVLLVIPLAVSSVFLAFALTNTPLSFPALIGILSLFGIVVTNSMFIVDKINLNIKEGMSFKEAIANAGSSRMEPIILTKLCTVLGLLPITFADPLWRGLGGAIISGLLIASTIMLFFIPVVYYQWMKPADL
ncbi:efflux RND transporter permease subunit [Candidatus Roizmanbacteria bacterium]|nr:efflux RND transporter permease subunit [Candidatus Roizmanbacteria bacterium]